MINEESQANSNNLDVEPWLTDLPYHDKTSVQRWDLYE